MKDRGLAHLDLKNYSEAKEDFETSLKISPNGNLAKAKLEWIAKHSNK
jgi:Tetratricopeptide repeat